MKILWKYHLDILAFGLGLFFTYVGILHFIDPIWFTPIVPDILPFSDIFWVILSGFPEVILGIGLLIPKTRCLSGKLTAILLVLLYWGNLNMWINNIPLDGITFTTTAHIARGLAQILMIAIACYIGGWFKISKN